MSKQDVTDLYIEILPQECEWLGGASKFTHKCTNAPIKGKSYCRTHYKQVFYDVSEDEFEAAIERAEVEDAHIHKELDEEHGTVQDT